MRRRVVVAVLALLAVGASAPAVAAPPERPPGGGCKVNRQYVTVDDSGTVTVGGGSGRPIDCYY